MNIRPLCTGFVFQFLLTVLCIYTLAPYIEKNTDLENNEAEIVAFGAEKLAATSFEHRSKIWTGFIHMWRSGLYFFTLVVSAIMAVITEFTLFGHKLAETGQSLSRRRNLISDFDVC
ncbi:MAG: hypothetical protein AAFW83_10895 [Pseudomonadota bacterium]